MQIYLVILLVLFLTCLVKLDEHGISYAKFSEGCTANCPVTVHLINMAHVRCMYFGLTQLLNNKHCYGSSIFLQLLVRIDYLLVELGRSSFIARSCFLSS